MIGKQEYFRCEEGCIVEGVHLVPIDCLITSTKDEKKDDHIYSGVRSPKKYRDGQVEPINSKSHS